MSTSGIPILFFLCFFSKKNNNLRPETLHYIVFVVAYSHNKNVANHPVFLCFFVFFYV